MPEDINSLIAMQRGQNPQGAFDPNVPPQQQIAQIQALAQQGLISPQQAQQFLVQIAQAQQQQQQGQQAPGSDVMDAIRQGGGPQSPSALAAGLNYMLGGPGSVPLLSQAPRPPGFGGVAPPPRGPNETPYYPPVQGLGIRD